MDGTKKFSKGSILIEQGKPITSIFLIRSGRATLNCERNGKTTEVMQLLPGQIVGGQVLSKKQHSDYTVKVTTDAELLELPAKGVIAKFDGLDPISKILLTGFVRNLKECYQNLRDFKLSEDTSPCPPKFVPKVFGMLALVVKTQGVENKGIYNISWENLRIQGSRVFLETTNRMVRSLEILIKLGFVEATYGKNEKGEEEFQEIKVKNLNIIDGFSGFYQYNFYRNKNESIHVDELTAYVLKALNFFAKDVSPDFKGNVSLNFSELIQKIKEEFEIELKNPHLDMLEQHGLALERRPVDGGVSLLFSKQEFADTYHYWRIARELDKWNKLGYVDMDVKEKEPREVMVSKCPGCKLEIEAEANFCSGCGFKLAA